MTIEISESARRETPAAIAELLDQPLTLLVARIFVVLPFFVSGLVKCFDWQAGLEEMTRAGLHPAWAFNLAVLVTEICGSLSILLKRRIWLGAGALGVFTVISTFVAHRFWIFSGEARTAQFNSFLEHWTISAAFILVVVVYLRERPASYR